MDNKEASDTPHISPEEQAELDKLIAKAEAESNAPTEALSSADQTHLLARLAPPNPYRVEVTDQVAIYRRVARSQAGMTCSILMLLFGLILPSAFLMLICFGVVSFSGETGDLRSSGTGLLMVICTLVFTWLAINIFLSAGLQELRVSRPEERYTLREAKGIPRRIVERSGSCSEMAGISIKAVKGPAIGAQTGFWVQLHWTDSMLKPLALAYFQDYESVGWGKAVKLQAQAAEDLGVPVNPTPRN